MVHGRSSRRCRSPTRVGKITSAPDGPPNAGIGRAKIATARKYLTLIYNTISNDWVFADFKNFELAE